MQAYQYLVLEGGLFNDNRSPDAHMGIVIFHIGGHEYFGRDIRPSIRAIFNAGNLSSSILLNVMWSDFYGPQGIINRECSNPTGEFFQSLSLFSIIPKSIKTGSPNYWC